ncbi:hypothetical protein D3C73_1442580 [compost metagenome]
MVACTSRMPCVVNAPAPPAFKTRSPVVPVTAPPSTTSRSVRDVSSPRWVFMTKVPPPM